MPQGTSRTRNKKLRSAFTSVYQRFFVRKRFYKLSKLFFYMGVTGLVVRNFENSRVSGEDHFLRHFSSQTSPLVCDVGANVGQYSNRVKELYPSATIYAFEPHPLHFKKLRQEAMRHNYDAFNVACGERAVRAMLYDYAEGEGSRHASLFKEVIEDLHGGQSIGWNIEVITLDRFFKQKRISKVDLLKVDTEGNDFNVLLGAREAIEKGMIEVIHFEFNEMNVISGVFLRNFRVLLTGYDFYRMLPDGLVPLDSYYPLFWELFAYQNVVAIHRRCNRSQDM